MRRRFSVDIISIFTFLILATVAGILLVVYIQNKHVAEATADKEFHRYADMVMENTGGYLKEAQVAVGIATELFKTPNPKLELDSPRASYLLKVFLSHDQMTFFYFGDERGNFLQAGRRNGYIYLKRIRRKRGKAETTFKYLDDDLKPVKTETEEDSKYDPRVRPWYVGAKKSGKTFWTEPYIFFENKRPGITVAVPVRDEAGSFLGVAAADITLDGLSDFLREAELPEHGYALITDANGRLLAFSGKRSIIKTDEKGLRTISPSELGLPQITAALSETPASSQYFSYFLEGEKYFAARLPFPDDFGKKWHCAILAPESDFTGPMAAVIRNIMYLSVATLVIGILLTMLLAKRISNPIELLSKDVLRIRNLDFDSGTDIDSHILEIQTMNDAIRAMKNSLKAFNLYVPSTLVKQLIASGEEIAIGGKEKSLTIFFSDIKNFTTIAEASPPRELMPRLADYFDAMTTAIEMENGTVDKFIGDAVMAFWGAPAPDATHPLRACKAALLCKKRIDQLNAHWKKEGYEPFHTRIGVHTGDAIVGNIGAKQRMNYTVIGDSVNLASRLEGVNKLYGTNIVISESTYSVVKELFICRVLDKIAVKGKNESVAIYELLAEKDDDDSAKAAELADGFQPEFPIFLNY